MLLPGQPVGSHVIAHVLEAGAGRPSTYLAGADTRQSVLTVFDSPEPAERSARSALLRAAAAVSHPALAPTVEIGEDPGAGIVWSATAPLHGVDTGTLRRDYGPVPASMLGAVISAVAAALDAGRQAGVSHGHLVPATIFVDPPSVDPRTGAGVTLVGLGGGPIDGAGVVDDLPALASLVRTLSPGSANSDIEYLLHRAESYGLHHFSTYSHFAYELVTLLTSAATPATGVDARTQRTSRTPVWLWGALVAGVVVILAIGVVVMRPWHNPDPPRAVSEGPRTNITQTTTPLPRLTPPPDAGEPGVCFAGSPPRVANAGALRIERTLIRPTELPSARDWKRLSSFAVPLTRDSLGLSSSRDNPGWIATITLGELDPSITGDPEEVGRHLLSCLPGSAGYRNEGPLDPVVDEVTTLDSLAVNHALLRGSISTTDAPVPGDTLQLIVIDTTPITYVLGTSPIGADATERIVRTAVEGVVVSTAE